MNGLKRISATLILLVLVACGQGATPGASAPEELAPSGPDTRPRLALVIGIGDYRGDIPSLPNPVRDAELMARSLQAVGFQLPTPIVRNATREQFQDALTSFARALDAAGPDAIGLIYFAGHGMQINGNNYLLPSDARRPSLLPAEAALLRRELSNAFMPAEELLLVLGSRPNGASILILDACRDNPLTRSIGQATRSGTVETRGGLFDMTRATGVLIAYATNPNEVSLDGGANTNSPYAEALAAEMLRGGTVYEVFNRTRGRVEDATGGRQSPKETNGLRGSDRFCFGACGSLDNAAAEAQAAPDAVERAAYEQALATRSSRGYAAFLEAYPNSSRAADIRTRLDGCSVREVETFNDETFPIHASTPYRVDNAITRGACSSQLQCPGELSMDGDTGISYRIEGGVLVCQAACYGPDRIELVEYCD